MAFGAPSARALLIDFGGTLDADGLPWSDRFFGLYREAGGVADRSRFDAAFKVADIRLAALPAIARCNYSETAGAQADLLRELLPDGVATTTGAIAMHFARNAAAIADRNRAVLQRLGLTHQLAVVSNFQGNLQPCLDELGLGDLFDVVSDSAVVGYEKPDSRIFIATLQALDVRAEECWMVGDSPANDITAAADLGMRTCWLAPAERPLVGTPTARVARFDELPAVVGA